MKLEPLVIELGTGGKAVFTTIEGGVGIVLERNGKTKSATFSDMDVDDLIKWLGRAQKPSADPGIDEAVDQAMEAIRESYYLTDEVRRSASLQFLEFLDHRLNAFYEELAHETVKHGDG